MISISEQSNAARATVEQLSQKVDRPVTGLIDWLGNNLEGLAIGALVAAGIVGLMLVLRRIGQSILASNPDCNNWKGIIGNMLAKTSVIFMIAAAAEIVANYANVPASLERGVDIFFLICAAFQGAIWARELIIGAVKSRVGEHPGESTLGNAMGIIRVLVSVAAFAIALIVILDNLGFNVTTLIAGLGIGGIAIGLAAQGIFADLFAGLAIVFDRPFRRGQQISWGARNADGSPTNTGTVERIGLKTTRIRSRGGEQIIVSNTKLLEQELTNVDEAKVYRIWLPFGVTYQTSPDVLQRMSELVQEVVEPIKGVRLVRCLVKGFGPSSIDFDLVYDDRGRDFDIRAANRSAICIGIARLFAREKIEFAYPTQTTFTAAPDGSYVMPYATHTASPPARKSAKQG
jgi:small-conductance mechanosensitive channel